MSEYQTQQGDYKVRAERSDIDPSYFYYHFWQYDGNEWHFLYKAPEVIMVDKLKEHSNLYSADGYDYWRKKPEE